MILYGVDTSKLYIIDNMEDECVEIIERDGVEPGEDALIAKFYYGFELAPILVSFLQQLSAEYDNANHGR